MGGSPSNVLRYWADVEALTAPQAEDTSDTNRRQTVTHVWAREYPWLTKRRPPENRTFRHIVRFGVFSRSEYDRELFGQLRSEKAEDHDTAPKGKERPYTYLGVFQVDARGVPLGGTLELAAFPVFFANLRGTKLTFDEYSAKLSALFDRLNATPEGTPPQPLDDSLVASLLSEMGRLLNWAPSAVARAPKLVVVTRVCKPNAPLQTNPVNGFFHEDIMRVLRALESGKETGLVKDYLAARADGERIDVADMGNVRRILGATMFPEGRWPSEHPLTLMQQAAVNASRSHLANGGIFSVNGPPGTGKTTLLMDMVAAVIVERAEVMAAIAQPKDAFEKKWEVRFSKTDSPSPVFALDQRLHGFLMVVASSNNGAVENITKELPDLEKIGRSYRQGPGYLEPCAAALLNGVDQDPEAAEDDAPPTRPSETPEVRLQAWGLVSAALGNKTNRDRVVRTLKATEQVADPDNPAKTTSAPAHHNIFRQIKETGAALKWPDVSKRFLRKLNAVRAVQKEIDGLEGQQARIRDLQAGHARRKAEHLAAEEAADAASATVREAEAGLERCREAFERADRNAMLLLGGKPGFLERLWALLVSRNPAVLDWQSNYLAALDRRRLAEDGVSAAERALANAHARLRAAESESLRASGSLAKANAELEAAKTRLAEALGRLPGLVMFGKVLGTEDERERQQMLPNVTPALTRARAELFQEAMQVHLAFAAAAGGVFSANLRRAFDMLSGDAALRDAIAGGAAPHLWATLSLAIPVVSTTFASFARCFSNLGAGSIGWLFIDEAGQAVPQHAVGALWRSKRAMVVGDPFQVEPVITLDRNVDQKLLRRHGVDERFRSTGGSTQTLADTANPYGTHMRTYTGDLAWVGCPLKVHRRCVDPMFSIANAIAYNDSMVLGKGKEAGEAELSRERPLLGASRWFDVPGAEGNAKHFMPAQGEAALRIITAYAENGWTDRRGFPELFVISPFRSAAEGMERLLRDRKSEWAPAASAKELDEWLDASVGTVHTFQGKEAESVVFLLGGETKGAIAWAAKTPNIINVAVTRAKRRLYVVGDRRRWVEFELAAQLGALPTEAVRAESPAYAP